MALFKQAVCLGRMQHIHRGHEKLIDLALENATKVIVLVGSAQKGGPDETEERNPFDTDFRLYMIERIYRAYGDRVILGAIADIPGENETDVSLNWGRHFLKTIDQSADGGVAAVDLMVYGNDENRMEWFNHPEIFMDAQHFNQLIVAHENNRISATKIRKYIQEGDFDKWANCVNPALFGNFEEIRKRMLSTKAYEGRG